MVNRQWQKPAVILLATVLLSACATQPPPSPAEEPAVLPPATAPAARPSESIPAPLPTLRIVAVGDMMIGTDYPMSRLPDDDAASFLADVTPLLSAADIAFGNLEGVLLDGGTPAKRCSNPAACYLFRSPTRYAVHYANAGFDAISLANNHARDFGEEGRTSSMLALDAYDIRHSGRDGTVAEWQVRGVRIAMAAFAVTRESNSMLDVALATQTIEMLAARNDVVVVSFHGGAEGLDALHVPFSEESYYDEPRGDVVRFARGAVDAGADLVIGHGPHVVRGLERYRERLIAYSLGNFATYYGISVAGLKGVAPVLDVEIDGNGRFVGGLIHSTVQVRPAGPSFDPESRALTWMRTLTNQDFAGGGLDIDDTGRIAPAER
ncbi:MAG: CapA family protein [Pseudomonadota bacterium]